MVEHYLKPMNPIHSYFECIVLYHTHLHIYKNSNSVKVDLLINSCYILLTVSSLKRSKETTGNSYSVVNSKYERIDWWCGMNVTWEKNLWDTEHSQVHTVDFRKENFRTSRKKRHETMTRDGNAAQDSWEVKLNVNVQCILLKINRGLQ